MACRYSGQFTTLPPGNPARTHGEVGALLHGLDQLGQLLGLVRAVGVHLHEDVVAGVEAPLEAGDVRRAQAGLARPVQDVDLAVLGGDAVRQLPRAVGAVVVDNQDVGGRHGSAQAPEGLGQRFQLVVGRDDGEDTHSEAFP